MRRYRIQFPPHDATRHDQSEAFFFLIEDGREIKLRFHDYDEIYRRPGLYEQIFYERLKCSSPTVVSQALHEAVETAGETVSELRVLDLGAGNGLMGAALKTHGVSRLVGADIIKEAADAAWRDRPDIYDDYVVADFTALEERIEKRIDEWATNCLTCVAALGFGDIPTRAFLRALRFTKPGGWVAFNIKETFLDATDTSGFSRLIRELIWSEYLDLHLLKLYRHRLSMEGTPLFYYAAVVRKAAEIPAGFLVERGIE